MLRLFNTIAILVGIGFFGVFDFTKDLLFGGLNTYDVLLVLLNLVFIVLMSSKKVKLFVTTKPFKYLYHFYLFTLIVMVSMPFRGEISLIDSIRVGRNFLLIPIAVLIWYDTTLNDKRNYYKNFILFITIITSIQIIITAINPGWISDVFPHIRAREFYKYGLQRNDFIANSMLFPHLGTLIIFENIIKKKLTQNNIILFLLFFTASSLQGFRSYFLVLSIILFIIAFAHIKQMRIKRYIIIAILLLPLVIISDNYFLNSQISNKFITSSMDIDKEEGSSLKGRFDRDIIYTIPMVFKKPILGWGFIYHDSKYGKSIGLDYGEKGQYSPFVLYSVDSGYLTLLNYFGFLGFGFLLFQLFKFMRYIYKNYHNKNIPLLGFLMILIPTLITHGGLYSDFGLFPLLITSGYILNNRNFKVKGKTTKLEFENIKKINK